MEDRETNEDVTSEAAELAERILDEVSQADQDWSSIVRWAAELAELAARAAGFSTGPESPPSAPQP